MTEWLFEEVTSENIRLLNHFLKQHHEQSANRGDWNYWLKQGGQILAVARLIPVEVNPVNGLWLRGVFVIEAKRKQGLGHQLMQRVHQDLITKLNIKSNESEQACSFNVYAFPYSHLTQFYQPLGYQTCSDSDLPDTLQKRYIKAQNSRKDWLCMRLKISASQHR